MKYLHILLLFLTLFCSRLVGAETYYVNTEVLNLRSCEGTHCEILGKLTSGEVVEVINDNGEWVEVQTDKGGGFVIKRSLTTNNFGIGDIIIGVIVIAFTLLIAWFFYFLPSRVAAGNKNANKIYQVNLLLGWIPVIWLLLLFAALIGESVED